MKTSQNRPKVLATVLRDVAQKIRNGQSFDDESAGMIEVVAAELDGISSTCGDAKCPICGRRWEITEAGRAALAQADGVS